MSDATVLYETRDRKAYITLNRPDGSTPSTSACPPRSAAAVARANDDPQVHVIVLHGAGRSFCSGYDLKAYAEAGRRHPERNGVGPDQGLRADEANTDDFMSLCRSLKPTICKVHGLRRGRRQRHRPVAATWS